MNPLSVRPFFILKLLCILIFTAACSTQKNNLVNRSYHNVTSHYNGYFNARERVKAGEQTLWEQHEDKYDRILSVFRHGDKQKAGAVAKQMDEAIDKASLVIQRHSMNIKGKEYCKWIDENYLVIGKAKYFKHDLYPAIEAFQFVAAQYPKLPTKYEALAYLVITYVQTGNQLEAESIVDYLKNEKKIPSNLVGFTAAASAYFYINVKNYARAIEQLTKAVAHTRKKQYKTRYIFILAQLHQHEGNNKKAYAMYEQVIKMNPAYEMAFNAKINRARVLDLDAKNSAQIKKELLKMLKDTKNKEYYDQIYYALAGISQREGNTEEAIKYLELSARTSIKNDNQKAISFLELAKIYFTKPDYRHAQTYYDSAATFLSKDHPDYESVQNKKAILNKLIKNLNTIAAEDSLQALAKLSPKELEKAVDKMIEQAVEAAEQAKREAAEAHGQNAILGSGSTVALAGGSQWYFYNPAAISFGYTEFTKKWGTRKSEDNWRRTNKESSDETATAEGGSDENDSAAGSIRDRQRYMKNIPFKEKQLEQSNLKIIEAFYGNAGIYREQLYDRKEAAKSLEELLKRYPENKYKLPCYYQLYRMYADIGNDERSTYYKNLLLNGYPDSEYAKVIRNPNYLKEMQTEKQKLNTFYSDTYNAYLNSEYEKVILNKDLADSLFPENDLAPKFSYLKALSIGKTHDINIFEASLQKVVQEYPKDPIRENAQDILDYINQIKGNTTEQPVLPPPVIVDSAASKAPHQAEISYSRKIDGKTYYAITYESGELSTELLGNILTAFNKKNFDTKALTLEQNQYSERGLLIAVKFFYKKVDAEEYFKTITKNNEVFSEFQGKTYDEFLISEENYDLFLQDTNVSKYKSFFRENYLK